jgi:hypothetical protein
MGVPLDANDFRSEAAHYERKRGAHLMQIKFRANKRAGMPQDG